MVTMPLIAILFGVIVILIQEKTKLLDKIDFLKRSTAPFFLSLVAGMFVGYYLNLFCLVHLIPADSLEVKNMGTLSSFKFGDEKIYLVKSRKTIDGKEIKYVHFLKEGNENLIDEKWENVEKNIIFTQNNEEGASIISINPTRKGFLRFFVFYPIEYKYLIPESGIKKGRIMSSFEFIPDK